MKLTNLSQNNLEISNVVEAKTFWQRSRGLMFRHHWEKNTALWIHRCNSIHTAFMHFPIDAVFVDKNLVVQKIFRELKSWRLVLPIWSARSVFEFCSEADITKNLQPGDQLHVGH